MEYYFYIILIFAIILKLTLYLCWYQVRRNAAAREVRIIMPDGSTRYAVVTNASGVTRTRASSEERQCLPQADSLSVPYDNQGMVESPIQPRFMGAHPQGLFPCPPQYLSGARGGQWKLPKYEEVDDNAHRAPFDNAQHAPLTSFLGQPPPYAPPTQTGSQGGNQTQPQVATNPVSLIATSITPSAIQNMASPPVYSMAAAIPTIPAATGTMAPSYATSPTTGIHINAASALGRGPSPMVSPQTHTIMPEVGQASINAVPEPPN